MSLRRVVVTGMGAVSPYGRGVDALVAGLRESRQVVRNLREEWAPRLKDLTCWLGAPAPDDWNPRDIPRAYRRTMGRVAQLAYLSAVEAMEDAGVSVEDAGAARVGVSYASTMGSAARLDAFFGHVHSRGEVAGLPGGGFFQFMSHTCAANLSHALGASGRVLAPCCACASSLQAIGLGVEAIESGRQDVMICGGADELHVMVSASFDRVQAASSGFNDTPEATPRPFDRRRDGIVCGEGAGTLILESEESARARGARIRAEMVSFATSNDAAHLAEPHADSIARCAREALGRAGLAPGEIGYINAHATGTETGDRAEAEAIRTVYGEGGPPVSSFKGRLGHTLGASGALETIAGCRLQGEGLIIPTSNLEEPGEGCEGLDHVVAPRRVEFDFLMKHNFAFGGANCALILKRPVA